MNVVGMIPVTAAWSPFAFLRQLRANAILPHPSLRSRTEAVTEKPSPMIRHATILLLATGLTLSATSGFAQKADAPHHTRKAAKPRKAAVPTAAPVAGGINAPSTDFSKIERSDGETGGPDGPTFRPTMGAGGMGLGGAF